MPEALPSATFHSRLSRALQAWELARARVGRGGNQAEIHRLLTERYGALSPSKEAVSKWVKGNYVPTLDYCHMLATVLGVRPAWLAFEDGEDGGESEEHRRKREFHEEQLRKYPPREVPQANPKKGRRAG